MGAIKGVFRSGQIVLDAPADWPDGTTVLVTPVATPPGTAAAVLAALAASPTVPVEWVDELEQLIATGRRPPTRQDPFAD
jgi:hypothetical protein